MIKKNKIEIERMIFLENWIVEHQLDEKMTLKEKKDFLKSYSFKEEEIDYLINASVIPYPILFAYWSSFKNSSIEMEPLKFFNTLQSIFNVSFDTIQERIKNVQAIDKYFLEKSKPNPFVNSEYYDQLLQDYIFNVSLYKNEMTQYKSYEEYWNQLLKQLQEKMNDLQNTLEKSERKKIILEMEPLLKEMARINSFSFNDIEFLGESNKKI